MVGRTLWVSEADVAATVELLGAIRVLERAFDAEGAGKVRALDKTMTPLVDKGTLHSLGAAFEDRAGVKSWAHTPGGAEPVLLLFDVGDGALVAAIEAFALGQLRTAAAAAVATDRLASPDAAVLGVIGTGKQALPQVAAVAAVRQLREVRVFSPSEQHRQDFARRVEQELELECRVAASPAEAVKGAGVVTLVTRATSPVLTADMVEPGLHVNAVGAIDLARQEVEPAVVRMASLVVTDSVEQCRRLSSELRASFGEDEGAWSALRSLGAVVHEGIGRSSPEQVTLFKGMGSGVEDVALGAEVLERCIESGRGEALERAGKVAPRLAVARKGDG